MYKNELNGVLQYEGSLLGCSTVQFEENLRFGGTYRLHLQGGRVNQAGSQQMHATSWFLDWFTS
jgi:hypothetical protein